MNAPDVKEKREVWIQQLPSLDIERLVFLDEWVVNTNLTRIYGRALGGERAVDKTPLNTPQNTAILSSIRLNGSTAYITYSGGTTGEKFVDYLKNILLPTLNDGDIIVMDNMRSHHVKEVKQVIEESGKKLLYLPPYSPDFNPIEKMRSKIKAILRKECARNLPDLYSVIGEAFSQIDVYRKLILGDESFKQYFEKLNYPAEASDSIKWIKGDLL